MEEGLVTIITTTHVMLFGQNNNTNRFNQNYNLNNNNGSTFKRNYNDPNNFILNINSRQQNAGHSHNQTDTQNQSQRQQNFNNNNSNPRPQNYMQQQLNQFVETTSSSTSSHSGYPSQRRRINRNILF